MKRKMTITEVMAEQDKNNSWRRFQVRDYPEYAEHGNFRLETFWASPEGRRATILKEGIERDTGSGVFHKLVEVFPGETEENGKPKRVLWMSDTRAEIEEHYPLFHVLDSARHVHGLRVLISGLGLGMVAHAAASYSSVERVDVVELNEDVASLIGPLLGPKVHVHVADAYDIQWLPNQRWDFAWHDIWPTITDENLEGMERLRNKYKKRCYWQGFWQIEGCQSFARVMRMMEDNTLPTEAAYLMLNGVVPWKLGY